MKEQAKNLPEDVKIGRILHSFKEFALTDIAYNIQRPIAAFILGSCFIDQMAAYRYNHGTKNNEEYYKKFIKEYLIEYEPFDLYNRLRCLLIHNYSLDEYISLGSESDILNRNPDAINANLLTARKFHEVLATAYIAFSKDLLALKSQARINALNRFDEAPVLVNGNYEMPVYNESDAEFLITYYSKLIIGKTINQNKSLEIAELKKVFLQPEVYTIEVYTKKKYRSVSHTSNLAQITNQLGLLSPIEALSKA